MTRRPDGVTIRESRPDDTPTLVGLIRELQNWELPHNRRLKRPEDIGTWYVDLLQRQCGERDGVILVAEEEGRTLGCAVIFTRVEETGEEEELAHSYAMVSELVVTEAARGRGVGRLLLAECERRSRQAGRDELRLGVEAFNETARRLYRSAGFSEVKIRMSKWLA